MIRKRGKAEKIAYEILGTPINMPQKKYRGTVNRDDLATEQQNMQQAQQEQMVGLLSNINQGQFNGG